MAGRYLKDLFDAFVRRDEGKFHAAAEAIIANEEAKQHVNLARDLRHILAGGNVRQREVTPLVPIALSRGADGAKIPLADVIKPQRVIDDLVLDPDVRDKLTSLAAEHAHRDVLNEHRVPTRRKLMFHGPPGCGKTSAAEALASLLGYPLAIVRIDALLSSYLGETLSNLRNVIDGFAWEPHVVLFDEFDALGRSRDDPLELGEIRRVVSGFLMMLEQFTGQSVLITATNHEDLLDHALWRRFDDILTFARPDCHQVAAHLQMLLKTIPHESIDIPAAAQALTADNLPYAAVEYAVWSAYRAQLIAGETRITAAALQSTIKQAAERPW